ncbi:PFL_4703 family integrating conjugative element protein [Leucothrix mucor]|uniref:PFL_4703 family integrating conjugative element protein n=1 Tax=Leucothrix mucor TaxID=45248 RepID=UPI0003B6CBFC|nr:TIGR03746 family integrating conjugative element protein [Leucothrix mucor]
MNLFDDHSENQTALIRVFGTIIFTLIMVIMYQVHTINNVRQDIRIAIPPDLSLGASLVPDEIPKTAVYDFASRIFQSLQRWNLNGAKDYRDNIEQYSDFFTPQYKAFLLRDFERRAKAGELNNRERALQPLLVSWDYDRVSISRRSNGLATDWVVALDMELQETYRGEVVKRLFLRYPMIVTRREVDRNRNPWGLVLGGYAAEPEPLTLETK